MVTDYKCWKAKKKAGYGAAMEKVHRNRKRLPKEP